MTMREWSTTAGSNGSGVTSVNWAEGQAPSTVNDSARQTMADVAQWYGTMSPIWLENVALAATVAANALTISLKSKAATDPTTTDYSRIPFRNATVSTGDYTFLTATAATSLVISSGSTMGAASATAFRLWIVAFNDAGTLRIGAINCLSTAAGAGAGRDVTAIYPLRAWGIASSTAEGGAGAADNAQTFYTGSAVSSKAYTVLGYMTWETGLTTAGTWDAAPTRVQVFGLGMALPGGVLQVQRSVTGTVATGTTVVPADNTIPQITEGDQYMTQAITPSSAANVLTMRAQVSIANDAAGTNSVIAALFQDATANALRASEESRVASNIGRLTIDHSMLAATTSATTLRVRAGGSAAGTSTFNGVASGQHLGGVMNSYLDVAEVMA